MNITTIAMVVAVLLVSALGSSPSAAQQAFKPPAELPPADYRGSQFVDSAGCVYIRAGQGSAATWVPRVTRDRKPVCGYVPSFQGNAATVQASAKAPVAAQEPSSVAASSKPVARPATSALVLTNGVALDGTSAQAVSPDTRILPRHLYERRKLMKPVKTPRGYRPAWQDGRLNLRRGEQTPAGQAQTRQIWTDTVPRRLVNP